MEIKRIGFFYYRIRDIIKETFSSQVVIIECNLRLWAEYIHTDGFKLEARSFFENIISQ